MTSSEPVVPRDGGALGLRVAAPPVGDKANAEVERFLAGKAGAEPSRVRGVQGFSGRDETVFVDGVGPAKVRAVLPSRPL